MTPSMLIIDEVGYIPIS